MTTIAERYAYFKRLIAQAIAIPVIILFLLAGLLVWQIQQLLQAAHWVDHSDRVITQADVTLKTALDAETGARGYVIGLNPVYLQPYKKAQDNIVGEFDTLANDVSDNPPQLRRVQAMRAAYDSWFAVESHEIQLRATDQRLFQLFYNQAQGKVHMDALRALFEDFIAREKNIRDTREAGVQRTTRSVLASCLFIAVAAGVVLGLMSGRRLMQVSREYEYALSTAQKTGEMLATTLLSIGDGVLVTDHQGRVTQINAVAEKLTGWSVADALGKKANEVFRIINETTRKTVPSPIDRVIKEGVTVGLANHTVLVRPDGTEVPIDDSGAPILDDNGKLIGVVLVFRDITERKRIEDQLAREYEKQHRIAEALQSSLLIKPPHDAFPHLETETLYRAARQEAKVGGDYYDLFPLGDGKVALVVGDISGKGLNAAAKTAELKYTLRGFLREHPHPATALSRLNAFICESLDLEQAIQPYFLCLAVVVVDPVSRTAEFAVGGSEPPLIARKSGKIEQASTTGMPLGVDPKAEFQGISRKLSTGDTLLVATDGITEARNGKDFLGIEGLADLAKECCDGGPLESIGNCLLNGAEEFSEGEFSDDVCLLLARIT